MDASLAPFYALPHVADPRTLAWPQNVALRFRKVCPGNPVTKRIELSQQLLN